MQGEKKNKKRGSETAFWILLPYLIIIITACVLIVAVIVSGDREMSKQPVRTVSAKTAAELQWSYH